MGWNNPDVYYQPEKFGLTQVAEIDDPEACYSFDLLVVWQHEDGRLFYGIDGGCSCPSPFEDFRTLDSLTPITQDTWAEFWDAVMAHCSNIEWHFDTEPVGDGWVREDMQAGRWHRRKPDPGPFAADKTELLAKVSGLLFGCDAIEAGTALSDGQPEAADAPIGPDS